MQLRTKIRILKKKWPVAIGAGVLLVAAAALLLIHTGHHQPPEETRPTEPEQETVLRPNPYDADSFGYDGKYLTCLEGESTLGVDVSEWQTEIDWPVLRQEGMEFAMIRVGRRGEEMGTLFPDNMAQSHYNGAKSAGFLVGGYFFSQAVSVEEAVEEAEYVIELVKDWELDLPIAFDWEHTSDENRTKNVDGQTLTACAVAFCERLRQAGYDTMVYFNWDYANNRLDLTRLAPYDFWFAMYENPLEFQYRVTMWQYTERGDVPGVTGSVDINLWLTYEEETNDE